MEAQVVTGATRVPLLEVAPTLADYLPPDGRDLARRLTVHLQTLPRGDVDLARVLDEAFAAVIVDGLLMHRMTIGEQPALRLLGSWDILTRTDGSRPFLLAHSAYRAPAPVSVAMLDDRVLWLAQRFPRLFAGLQARIGLQQDRIAAQLAACQLPRVEDRLVAMMWLLAESWGRVTPNGTLVPVSLTHDALGELVGARRSTVSLALKQLAEDGAVVRTDGGWLLLKPLYQASAPEPLGVEPQLISNGHSPWAEHAPAQDTPAENTPAASGVDLEALSAAVKAMSESHRRDVEEFRSRLARTREAGARNRALREQIATQQRRRSPAP